MKNNIAIPRFIYSVLKIISHTCLVMVLFAALPNDQAPFAALCRHLPASLLLA